MSDEDTDVEVALTSLIFLLQYKTARSGGKELQAILHKRKEMADRKDSPRSHSPEAPDYSDSESKSWLSAVPRRVHASLLVSISSQ